MVLNGFPCAADEFIEHHGVVGAKQYLQLAKRGIELLKKIATKILPLPDKQLKSFGTLYVAEADNEEGAL